MMGKVIFLYIYFFHSKGMCCSDIINPVEKESVIHLRVHVHHYSTHKEMDSDLLRSVLSSIRDEIHSA